MKPQSVVIFTFLIIYFTLPSPGQQKNTLDLSPWKFLIGEWVGEGTGSPGEGTGGFTLLPDLRNTILVRRNHADYPASNDRPAFSHDDLMIIHQNGEGSILADYFDNEGHVIHYAVNFTTDSNSIIFLSDTTSPGPVYKLTYVKIDENTLSINFDIRSPGNSAFKPYITAKARRRKDHR